jgi:phage/plasmid-like protein (TIGR03299 family)
MSKETSTWLNQNTLIGYSAKRGQAWHYRAGDQAADVPAIDYPKADVIRVATDTGVFNVASNHYSGAIPVRDVNARLFHWDAVQVPMAYDVSTVLGVDNPVWKQSAKKVAWVRSDTLAELGNPSPSWTAHPYSTWLVETTHQITDGEIDIASAGLLKGGAQAWVSYEVPDTITTPEGVDFRPQLLATTSFDGSLATTYKRVTTLTVCDNTLAAALGEQGQQLKIMHSKYSHFKLMDAREALSIVHQDADDFTAAIAKLCATPVKADQFGKFLDQYVPLTDDKGQPLVKRGLTMAENKRETLTALYRNDNRVAPWAGTAFGLLQMCNTWFHHNQIVRNASRPERNMDNVLNGRTAKHDEEVLSLIEYSLA